MTSTTSLLVIATQDTASPVVVHLMPEQGKFVSYGMGYGSNVTMNPWPQGPMGGMLPSFPMTPTTITLPPRTTVTLGFVAAPHNSTKVPFRVNTMTPDGPKFGFTLRANVAPGPTTVVAVSPYFNRVPILAWFMIGLILFGIVLVIAALACGLADPIRKQESRVQKPIENGYLIAVGVMGVLLLGFLVFWSIVQGFKDKSPSATKCQETKATVARGSGIYSYSFGDSAWLSFLCRVMGICSCK